jgi:hypothetical protein
MAINIERLQHDGGLFLEDESLELTIIGRETD